MRRKQDYQVRMDLKNALPGPYFQLLGALSIMLEGLTQKHKFDVRLEAAELGALDDVVVDYYYDSSRKQKIETRYLQFKHSIDNTEALTEGDIKNQSGKLEIFKYFDDWYLFIVRKQDHAHPHKCIYYTNRALDSHLQNKVFTQTQNEWQFSSEFYKTQLWQNLLEVIKKNSVLINKTLIDSATSLKIAKNPTYKEAKNYYQTGGSILSEEWISYFLQHCYRIQANQPHVEALEKQFQDQIQGYFVGIADTSAMCHALIFEAWQWFRATKDVEIWTETTLSERLEQFKSQYFVLPEHVGKFLGRLQCQTITDNVPIPRSDILKKIKSTIETPNNPHIVFYGDSRIGKTWLIAEYLLSYSSLKQNSYYYFSSPQEFNKIYPTIKSFNHITTFIIDGVQDQREIPGEDCSAILSQSKRIIFISLKSLNCPTEFRIPGLSDDEVNTYWQAMQKNHNNGNELFIECGEKRFSQEDALILLNHLRMPRILAEIFAGAFRNSKAIQAENSLLSSKVPYIPLMLEQVIPLYSLSSLVHSGKFADGAVIYLHETTTDEFRKTLPPHYWLNNPEVMPQQTDSKLIVICDNKIETTEQLRQKYPSILNKSWILAQTRKNYFASLLFITCHCSNSSLAFEIEQNPHYLPLPVPITTITREYSDKFAPMLNTSQFKKNTLIAGVAGSGKSEFVKQFKKYWQQQKLNAPDFEWIIVLPATQLKTIAPSATMSELVSAIEPNWCKPWQQELLRQGLQKNKILFLIDAFDELKPDEREHCGQLLKQLSDYGMVIWTLRLEDRLHLPFNFGQQFNLKKFTDENIATYVTSRFADNPDFSKAAQQFLRNDQNLLELLGLPLQCYLLCEAWQPYYEARFADPLSKTPWEESSEFTVLHLYQQFTYARLHKFLQSHVGVSHPGKLQNQQRVYALCQTYLTQLQAMAFQHIFNLSKLSEMEPWLREDLPETGLVTFMQTDATQLFQFVHKTYAEYFAAVYLANLAPNNKEEFTSILHTNRYNMRYKIVWKFLALIFSYGDLMAPNCINNNNFFWQILISGSCDIIGIVEQELVDICLNFKNKQIFKIETDKSVVELQLNVESSRLSADKSPTRVAVIEAFSRPQRANNLKTEAILIDELSNKNYSETAKPQYLNFLIERANNEENSIVCTALARALGKTQQPTEAIIAALKKLANVRMWRKNNSKVSADKNIKHQVAASLIALGHGSDSIVIQCLLNAIEVGDSFYCPTPETLLIELSPTSEQIEHMIDNISLDNASLIYQKAFEFGKSPLPQALIEKAVLFLKKQEIGLPYIAYCCLLAHNKGSYLDAILEYFNSNKGQQDFLSNLFLISQCLLLLSADKPLRENILNKAYQLTISFIEKKEKIISIPSLIQLLSQFNRITPDLINKLVLVSDSEFRDVDMVLPSLEHLKDYLYDSQISTIVQNYLTKKLAGKSVNWQFTLHQVLPTLQKFCESNSEAGVDISFNCYKHASINENDATMLQGILNSIPKTLIIEKWLAYFSACSEAEENKFIKFLYEYCKYNCIALVINKNQLKFYIVEDVLALSCSCEKTDILQQDIASIRSKEPTNTKIKSIKSQTTNDLLPLNREPQLNIVYKDSHTQTFFGKRDQQKANQYKENPIFDIESPDDGQERRY
jgi:NACHT domain